MTTAAFFDLDGTLLPAPSLERRYLQYLHWRGDLRLRHWLQAAWRMLPLAIRANWSWETKDAGEGEWTVMAANNKTYLAGVPCWTMRAFVTWLRQYPLALFPDAKRRLVWHIEQGHALVLVTGAPAPLAEAIAREIHPRMEVLATCLENNDGRWTGRVIGRAMTGIEKSRAIARLAAARHWYMQNCFAYGDSWADRWMLRRAGHAVAVNASRKLEKLAREERWPVARWTPAPQKDAAVLSPELKRYDFIERLRESAQQNGYALSVHPAAPAINKKESCELHALGAVEESQSRPAVT